MYHKTLNVVVWLLLLVCVDVRCLQLSSHILHIQNGARALRLTCTHARTHTLTLTLMRVPRLSRALHPSLATCPLILNLFRSGSIRDLTNSYKPLFYVTLVHGLAAGLLLLVIALRCPQRSWPQFCKPSWVLLLCTPRYSPASCNLLRSWSQSVLSQSISSSSSFFLFILLLLLDLSNKIKHGMRHGGDNIHNHTHTCTVTARQCIYYNSNNNNKLDKTWSIYVN